MEINVKVQYMGVIRLLINKREDTFTSSEALTLRDLIEEIGKVYGEDIKKECQKQAFILYPYKASSGQHVMFLRDYETVIGHGYLVKVISPITGG